MNYKFLAVLIFIQICSLSLQGESLKKQQRVAIIFNGDDPDSESALAQSFKNIEIDGVLLYKAAGFDKTIVLSKSQGNDRRPTAQNLVREIGNLDNVSELQIHFIAHGSGTPIPSGAMSGYGMVGSPPESEEELQKMMSEAKKQNDEYEKRFTSIPLTQYESRLYSERMAKPGKFEESKFYIETIEPSSSSENNPNVGIGDLKESLKIAKEKNPEMNTTIYTGACFSGSLARAFADTPNTQIFAASQAVLYAWGIPSSDKSKKDNLIAYDELFQKQLRGGRNYLEAHTLALEDYLKVVKSRSDEDKYLNSELSASIPRSGLQEYVINWCIRNKKTAVADTGNARRKVC